MNKVKFSSKGVGATNLSHSSVNKRKQSHNLRKQILHKNSSFLLLNDMMRKIDDVTETLPFFYLGIITCF